jgi:hypothetical protein
MRCEWRFCTNSLDFSAAVSAEPHQKAEGSRKVCLSLTRGNTRSFDSASLRSHRVASDVDAWRDIIGRQTSADAPRALYGLSNAQKRMCGMPSPPKASAASTEEVSSCMCPGLKSNENHQRDAERGCEPDHPRRCRCSFLQNTSFNCTHMLRTPLSVESRFRKRPGRVLVTSFSGKLMNWG